jgi:chloramphenicol-sensitive protein RarD
MTGIGTRIDMNRFDARHPEQGVGAAAALAAFLFWGVVPIYFKWLHAVGPWEIIAHRIIWAAPLLAIFLLLRDGREFFHKLRLPPRLLAGLLLSGLLVAFNWLVFVWAVVNDQVLATSLGYFINPLVNVLLGFLFLQERLSGLQKSAVAIAAAGTAYLAWFLGQPPWVSLMLGFSFGFYGLVRKRLPVGPMTGLMWEVLLLLLPAIAYLAWRASQGDMDFLHRSARLDTLLLLTGLVTILPLIWFNMAAQRLSLTVVGFFQYLAPTITFLLAVFFWDEPFTRGHAVAFACIWMALLLVSVEPLRNLRRGHRHG